MDWKKFFSEPGTVLTILGSGVLGLIIGIANGVIQKRHGGWPAFFGAIATGTVVAVIVGLGLTEYVKSEPLRFAIIGVCAVVSDDIYAGLKTLAVGFRTDPLRGIAQIIDAFRGKLPPSAPSAPKE